MKKVFVFILFVGLFYFGYKYLKRDNLEQTEEKALYQDILDNLKGQEEINKFTIYGKNMNIEGTQPLEGEYILVLKNENEEILLNTLKENNEFKTSNYINEGINLEKLKVGEYLVLLKNKIDNTYYSLINTTNYHDNEYYTITRNGKNNLITFHDEEKLGKKYFLIRVEEKKLPDNIYDIVIDAGHGGVDTGASNGNYVESKFTLDYAKSLKEALSESGLKVKLTRENDDAIEHYGKNSRTGIPYEVKAKLMLSIHLNSSNSRNQRGVEIYTAYNDNYDYATIIAKKIHEITGIPFSNNPISKVGNGVYMRIYDKSDIAYMSDEARRKNYTPYTVEDNTTYYYFIRETGGINTKAFSDGRNPQYKENIYRNYNQGVEAYLCELAYISQNDDLKLILNKKDDFIKALKESILSYLEQNNNE